MHILFKLATRSRREKAMSSIRNIIENCNSDDYMILVSVDYDDPTMVDFHAEFDDWHVKVIYGTSKNKIDAVNRDINPFSSDEARRLKIDWDILVNTSDDMVFTTKGFDDIIRQDFGDNLDQVLHYNDGNQKDNVCTMSIMGREYYDRFGYIYHPDYKSLWCDVEATEVAYMLGKYRYMGDDKILFRHMHPAWGLTDWDEQYRKTEDKSMWDHDRRVIDERRSRSYDLPEHLIINQLKYQQL